MSARRFKTYPVYKDSGIEWLGEIPAGWQIRRLRSTVTSCQNGIWGDEPDGLHDVACVRVADFNRVAFSVDVTEPTLRSIYPAVVASRGLRPGNLLLEKSGGGENQPVGAVVLFDHRMLAVCSNFIARVTIADGHNSRYQTYLHAALYAQRINTRHIKQSTGIQNLDSSSYLNEAIGLPPEPEQRAIAAFLDRETERIDALVAKKERLIGLLQEQRTALITRAVTKGLDQTVPMKDSGVEWLGEIPAHWELRKLKHVCERVFVGIAEAATFAYVDDGVPMLRSTDVRGNRILTDDIRRIDRLFAERLLTKRLRTRDIVTVRTGNAGVSAVVPSEYDGGQCFTLVVSRPAAGHDSRYFCYWLNASVGQQQFAIEGLGTAQINISVPIVQNVIVCVPPSREQKAVAEFLGVELRRRDAMIAKIREAIERLKELRNALISSAVIGKIDVREEVA
jgi:type I restriction enzyme, S subunit